MMVGGLNLYSEFSNEFKPPACFYFTQLQRVLLTSISVTQRCIAHACVVTMDKSLSSRKCIQNFYYSKRVLTFFFHSLVSKLRLEMNLFLTIVNTIQYNRIYNINTIDGQLVLKKTL